MQQPTLQNVRIRSTRDALQIFYAVARNILPITSRRLDAEERRAIIPGNVYVWEERCANAEATGLGMERWTDGMGWGPSRVRDEFLFYHQRESEPAEDPNNPSAKWANIMKRREPRTGGPSYSRTDSERLIKQTYSVHVTLPEDRPHNVTRKWHLTAYFSQTTLDSLSTLDKIPAVGNVTVPRGWFRSARASKTRRADHTVTEDVGGSPQDPWGLGSPPPTNFGVSQFPLDGRAHSDGPWTPSSRPPYPSPQQQPQQESPYSPYHEPSRDAPRPPSSFEPVPAAVPSASAAFPPRLPTLSDAGLGMYRDTSPFTQGSSTASEFASSPRSSSSHASRSSPHSTPTPSPTHRPAAGGLDLVPLDYLQNIQPPARDPMDAALLQRLAAVRVVPPRFAQT